MSFVQIVASVNFGGFSVFLLPKFVLNEIYIYFVFIYVFSASDVSYKMLQMFC